MKVCAFNKNHIIKRSLLKHYLKSHQKEYEEIQNNGWYCKNSSLTFFKDQIQKDKHDENCKFCKGEKNDEDISVMGHKIIESKMPEEKKHIDFPKFNFDEYIKQIDKKQYLKKEDFQNEIDEEINIIP